MAELKALFESMGCSSVVTYLQSGNVVFNTDDPISSEAMEQAIAKELNLQVPVKTISANELRHIATNNPYLNQEQVDPAHCYVTFLWESPHKHSLSELTPPSNEAGRFCVENNSIYLHCPNGYGRTKIHNGFFEKKLGLLATTRNWKTVLALLDLSSQ